MFSMLFETQNKNANKTIKSAETKNMVFAVFIGFLNVFFSICLKNIKDSTI